MKRNQEEAPRQNDAAITGVPGAGKPEVKTGFLVLVGTGLIGAELLEQIRVHHDTLLRERGIDLRVVALANSRRLLTIEKGIDLKAWRVALAESKLSRTDDRLLAIPKEKREGPYIFVDCTTSEDVVALYPDLLGSGISLVTPNKKANVGSYSQFTRLAQLARSTGAGFLYETNVGAGLPVISVLDGFRASGDRITSIEAVLSGTLSYIFNDYSGETPFSEVVLQARAQGFTEPDPRDDLHGTDVARKLLILARVSGYPLEWEDLEVESLVPASCAGAPTIEAFLEGLRAEDAVFEARRKQAAAGHQVLRYLAELKNGEARVGLRAVSASHPCYNLTGCENLICFTTPRYDKSPLVIKGPGAGPVVTAAGVFADIVRIVETR